MTKVVKVICIKNGNNETLPCFTIGKIYDAEEGRPTSAGFGVEDLACDAFFVEYKEVLDIKNSYYWLTSDNNVTYNYDKKFFITLAEYRDNQINSILNDE